MKKKILNFTNRRFAHVGGTTPEEAAKALKDQAEKDKQAALDKKKKEEEGEADTETPGTEKDEDKDKGTGGDKAPEVNAGDLKAGQPAAGENPEPGTQTGNTEPEPEIKDQEEPENPAFAITVPTEAEIEKAAIGLAGNPDLIEPTKRMLARAEQIIADRKKQPAQTLTDEEQSVAEHEAKVKQFGNDYVSAERMQGKQKQTRTFSRQTWVTLGTNKSGWKEITKEMPEAKEATKTAAAPAASDAKKPAAKPTQQAKKPTKNPAK